MDTIEKYNLYNDIAQFIVFIYYIMRSFINQDAHSQNRRYLLSIYFSVIRRKIADAVPKTIMAYLVRMLLPGASATCVCIFQVKPTMEEVHNVLVEELYREDQFDDLLAETAEVTERRDHLAEMLKALDSALALLDEVVEVGANTVV